MTIRLNMLQRINNTAIKNGMLNSFSNVFASILGMINSILVVRNLSTSQYGELSFYLWISSIVFLLGTLSFPVSLTKITAEIRGERNLSQAERLTGWILRLVLMENIFIIVALFVYSFFIAVNFRIHLMIIALLTLPNSFHAVLRSFFWGMQKYLPASVSFSIASLIQFCLIFLFTLLNYGPEAILFGILSIQLVQFFIMAFYILKSIKAEEIRLPFWESPESVIKHRYWKYFLPALFAYLIEVIVWQRSEIFFLKQYSSLEQIGFYNLAYTIFGILLAIGNSLINGFFPAISNSFGANDWQLIRRRIFQGLALTTIYISPVVFGGLSIMGSIIILLYGQKMLPSVFVIQILLISLIPAVMGGMLSLILNSSGKIWFYVKVGLVSCLLNFALDFLIIPSMGAVGAAIATAISQLILSFILMAYIQHTFQLQKIWRNLLKICFLGFLTAGLLPIALQTFLWKPLAIFLAIPLAAISYFWVIKKAGYLKLFTEVEWTV